MQQPVGFVDKDMPDHVCRLRKSIYGLKQASRCWNNEIDTFLQLNGYKKCSSDGCIYMKTAKQEDGQMDFVILSLWVDDILLFLNNTSMRSEEKKQLNKRCAVIDQGEGHYVLGMLVKRDLQKRTMTINQENFLKGILKRYGMEDCKPVSTPLEAGRKFQKLPEKETPVEVKKYQQMIGSLAYVAIATRPDLAAAVNTLSKFMAKPGKEHMEGVKRILRYIEDIGLKKEGPTTIHEDNNGAIELSKNPKFHDRTKHIDVAHHFVREKVAQNSISVKYC